MVSFFKEKSPAAVFGLVIVSILTRSFFLTQSPEVITSPNDGLIYFLLKELLTLPVIVLEILYHGIVVIQALRLNYALNNTRMFTKYGYTTGLAYVLLTSLLPAWNNISSALAANSIIIWLLFRIIKLYNTNQPKTLVYNIGLITGLTVLIYFPSCPLVILVFFSLASFRPFRPNEWMILLLGIITPFYFLAGWLYFVDQLDMVLNKLAVFHLRIITPLNLPAVALTLVVAGIAIITGIFFWQTNSGRMVIQVRKNWSVLFVMLLLFIPVVFFINNAWPDALLLCCIPAAAFVSNSFLYPKKNIGPNILFWIFILLTIYNNWYLSKI